MKYTIKDIETFLGFDAITTNGRRITLKQIDIQLFYIDYIRFIPYMDQIETKKLFKLIILQNRNE